MISLFGLGVRLDLLVFFVTLILSTLVFSLAHLTRAERDTLLSSWFYAFLAWKGSAILLALLEGNGGAALYATGGRTAQVLSLMTLAFFVYRTPRPLYGYWVASALIVWCGQLLVTPRYGGSTPAYAPFPEHPVHLYAALGCLLLLVYVLTWVKRPDAARLLRTGGIALFILTMQQAFLDMSWTPYLIGGLALFLFSLWMRPWSQKTTRRAVIALVFVAALYAVAPSAERAETPESGLAIGQLAPVFTLQDGNGHPVSLSDYRGQTVVVNFWASWCPPCRAEMPDMETFQRATNIPILAVNTTTRESSQAEAKRFADEHADAFDVVYDEDGSAERLYRIQAMPTTFVIGPDGRIVAKQFGAIDEAWLEQFAL